MSVFNGAVPPGQEEDAPEVAGHGSIRVGAVPTEPAPEAKVRGHHLGGADAPASERGDRRRRRAT